ncbi:hypothetical protein PoB_001589500 [Plakobranchus ocellatus]|uniref:Uncharacterized protein n=1 Tax=Plakobranchus ocellatus TaxID=259542 RepID=A0AAV3Z1X6_9GAST|nr:hypothetical protein PoB_001589500 [Plakobranchus ocellatus]
MFLGWQRGSNHGAESQTHLNLPESQRSKVGGERGANNQTSKIGINTAALQARNALRTLDILP